MGKIFTCIHSVHKIVDVFVMNDYTYDTINSMIYGNDYVMHHKLELTNHLLYHFSILTVSLFIMCISNRPIISLIFLDNQQKKS